MEGIKEAGTLGGGCSCLTLCQQVSVLNNIKAYQLEVAWVNQSRCVPGSAAVN
jgi:hypothetical protein